MVECSPSPEPPRHNGAPCEIPQSAEGQATSSDSEDDQLMSHEGYELLSQQTEDDDATLSGDTPVVGTHNGQQETPTTSETGPGCSSELNDEPDPMKAEREERLQLWAGPGGRDIVPMDEMRTQQVLQAMAGFSLPSSAVPAWASAVPEDQWRARLDERLQAMKGQDDQEVSMGKH